MRVFLFQTAKGLFASSGGYKANISVLRHLTSRGYPCKQMCYAREHEVDTYIKERKAEGCEAVVVRSKLHVPLDHDEHYTVRMWLLTDLDGIQAVALDVDEFMLAFPEDELAAETADFIENGRMTRRLQALVVFWNMHICLFRPTHVIFNDALSLKATSMMPALKSTRRVCVVHTAEQLPFGPFAGGIPGSAVSPNETSLLRGVDGIWSVSLAIRDYALKHGNLDTTFHYLHPWTYLDGKTRELPPRHRNWDKRHVAMINPSPIKGCPIFIELARRCPQFRFATWCSWGSTKKVKAQLQELSNIDVYPTCRNMEDAWSQIKVLLVPSLWHEAWGLVVVEAQLRGIPVISSDVGGIPQAKLELPYIIHVNSLTGDRQMLEGDEEPTYVVPEQDVSEWVPVVEKLMTDKGEYEWLSNKVRNETMSWLKGLDESALESWLLRMRADEEIVASL